MSQAANTAAASRPSRVSPKPTSAPSGDADEDAGQRADGGDAHRDEPEQEDQAEQLEDLRAGVAPGSPVVTGRPRTARLVTVVSRAVAATVPIRVMP